MFCKFCGKQIDAGTMRCKACGRPVGPLEGGNGFWDLAGEEPPAPAPAPGEDPAFQELQKQVDALRAELEARPVPKKSAIGAIAALLALLALAACFYGFMQIRDLAGKLEETNIQLHKLTEMQEAQAARIEAQEQPVQAVFFTQQPTDAAPELDRAVQDEYCENGLWLFEAAFEGNYGPYLCYWEKVEGDPEDPEYTRVSRLDGDLFLEIEVAATEEGRTCRLYSKGPIRPAHEGVYVFTVEDYLHNFYRSDPVKLTVLRNGKPLNSGSGAGETTAETEETP